MNLGELAARLGGSVWGDATVQITGVATPQATRPGAIVYAADAPALRLAEENGAAALLIPEALTPLRTPAVRAPNGRLAFARLLALFAPAAAPTPGVDPRAVLGADVVLGPGVHVGPYAVLGDRVRLGGRTAVLAGAVLGADVSLGEDCTIYPHVTIRDGCRIGNRVILHPGVVVGSDGFGYAQDESGHVKLPHLGRVVIEDDVEIGANTTIDRATLGETRIGAGSKIDNLVQIAHNVSIGRRVLIAGQVGLAGSVTLGDGAILAGQAGVADHVRVGEGAIVMGRAAVTKDILAREIVSGMPARSHRSEVRLAALIRRLPDLFAAVEALQRRVAELAGGRERRSGP